MILREISWDLGLFIYLFILSREKQGQIEIEQNVIERDEEVFWGPEIDIINIELLTQLVGLLEILDTISIYKTILRDRLISVIIYFFNSDLFCWLSLNNILSYSLFFKEDFHDMWTLDSKLRKYLCSFK